MCSTKSDFWAVDLQYTSIPYNGLVQDFPVKRLIFDSSYDGLYIDTATAWVLVKKIIDPTVIYYEPNDDWGSCYSTTVDGQGGMEMTLKCYVPEGYDIDSDLPTLSLKIGSGGKGSETYLHLKPS